MRISRPRSPVEVGPSGLGLEVFSLLAVSLSSEVGGNTKVSGPHVAVSTGSWTTEVEEPHVEASKDMTVLLVSLVLLVWFEEVDCWRGLRLDLGLFEEEDF